MSRSQPLAEASQRGYATGGDYGRDSHPSPQRNQSSHQPPTQPSHKNCSPIARARHDASRHPDDAQPSALSDRADPDSAPAGHPLPFFFPMRPSARGSSPPDGQERGGGGREGERVGYGVENGGRDEGMGGDGGAKGEGEEWEGKGGGSGVSVERGFACPRQEGRNCSDPDRSGGSGGSGGAGAGSGAAGAGSGAAAAAAATTGPTSRPASAAHAAHAGNVVSGANCPSDSPFAPPAPPGPAAAVVAASACASAPAAIPSMLDMSLGLTSSSRSLLRLPAASASAAAAAGAGISFHATAHDAIAASPRSHAAAAAAAARNAAGSTADGGAAGGVSSEAARPSAFPFSKLPWAPQPPQQHQHSQQQQQHSQPQQHQPSHYVHQPHQQQQQYEDRGGGGEGGGGVVTVMGLVSNGGGHALDRRVQRPAHLLPLLSLSCPFSSLPFISPLFSCPLTLPLPSLSGREWGFVLTNEADEFSDWRISSLSQDTTTATAAASAGAAGTAAASGAATTSAVSAPEQEDSQSHQSLSDVKTSAGTALLGKRWQEQQQQQQQRERQQKQQQQQEEQKHQQQQHQQQQRQQHQQRQHQQHQHQQHQQQQQQQQRSPLSHPPRSNASPANPSASLPVPVSGAHWASQGPGEGRGGGWGGDGREAELLRGVERGEARLEERGRRGRDGDGVACRGVGAGVFSDGTPMTTLSLADSVGEGREEWRGGGGRVRVEEEEGGLRGRLGKRSRGEIDGEIRAVSGPVTCAKTLYEDATSFLILVSLPFADLSKLRVTWRNSLSHGIVKVQCASSMRQPSLIRWDRAFHLTDPHPEHCPPGEFVREIVLPSRIPDSADVKAFFSDSGGGVEILVPKLVPVSQYHEREVRVFLPPKTAS
ncbi:unnamed protein product [Closterium sp. NIES-54]